MAQSDILASFLGALQAAISVELTLIYGLLAAYFGLISDKSVKQLSVCSAIETCFRLLE
jgi:auxin efflux carrier family protein